MATYNGAAFLTEQLASLCAQTHSNWSLWVSDDGSSDQTPDILADFQANSPQDVHVFDGPRRGTAANFLSLLYRVDPDCDAFAFCDQDDYWLKDRIARSLAVMGSAKRQPILCGARTIIADHSLRQIGLSPLFGRPMQFPNALVQSFAGGNTMMFNPAALNLLQNAGRERSISAHDWWAYQIISGAGGQVRYDPQPSVLYRQHAGNQVGSNMGMLSRLHRAKALWKGRFRHWNARNLTTLAGATAVLTRPNRVILSEFSDLRHLRGAPALAALNRAGLYRQTRGGNWALRAAAMMGKL
jgi:glycosyltransferase involved in cell wall biosynthesis